METLGEKKMRAAILRGAELLVEHGLGDWKIGLHNSRRTIATCSTFLKRIEYSRHFITIANRQDFEGATLHEIAHALVGNRHGHDYVWQAKCRELSGNGRYASPKLKGFSMQKYMVMCPKCLTAYASNIKKSHLCGHCRMKGKEVNLIFRENKLQVTMW